MRDGPKTFLISFFLTLAVLLPLLGGFAFYGIWKQKTAEKVNNTQIGVPIQSATQENDQTILVAVAAEEPAFVLLRLNGLEGTVRISPIPAQSVLVAPSGPMLLRDSYTTAGPGRASVLLGETLNIEIDHYIAITPASLGTAWNGMEPLRVNLTGLLNPDELEKLGLSQDPVVSLAPENATSFLAELELAPIRLARVRAAIWDAAFRQQQDLLAQNLIEGLRQTSGTLLTDLTVTDMYTLQKTLDWLAKKDATVETQPVPGQYDAAVDRYEFNEDSVTFARKWFCVRSEETTEESGIVQQIEATSTPQPSPTPQTSPAPSPTVPLENGPMPGALG